MSEKQAAANTPLESFFDLVYTLALTLVINFVLGHLDLGGVLQGAALVMALWWSWACYSWLTDAIPVHSVLLARILILAATATIAVASLALPEAFGKTAVLFAGAYLVVRLLHIGLYLIASNDELRTFQTILRLAPGFLGGPILLVVASFVQGQPRAVLWVVALGLDYLTPLIHDVKGLRIHADHFAERYGLVIILVLGETITMIGEIHGDITLGIVISALLSIILCAALWWAYFDYVKDSAKKRLMEARGDDRAHLARDAYSYLHLLMAAGIFGTSLGLRQMIEGVDKPLAAVPAGALCGGIALYLIGLDAFCLRVTGTIRIARLVAAVLSIAVLPLALAAPSIIAVGIVTVVVVGLVAYETIHPGQFRREVVQSQT
jgi:low temperature requirement protein LtrA